jgi:hypothetical protein
MGILKKCSKLPKILAELVCFGWTYKPWNLIDSGAVVSKFLRYLARL